MSVRVKCDRCGGLAIIQSSKEVSAQVKQLYCSCSNPECGHTFVCDLTFSHTLSPSALDLPNDIRQKIRSTTRTQQQTLFATLGA